jgi:hypothetical protein
MRRKRLYEIFQTEKGKQGHRGKKGRKKWPRQKIINPLSQLRAAKAAREKR